MEKKSQERRVHPRVNFAQKVEFRLTDMSEFMKEYADNISAGGIFINTQNTHPVNTDLDLKFRLTDDKRVINIRGKVVHENLNPNIPGMGIEFHEIDEETSALIDKIVLEQLNGLLAELRDL